MISITSPCKIKGWILDASPQMKAKLLFGSLAKRCFLIVPSFFLGLLKAEHYLMLNNKLSPPYLLRSSLSFFSRLLLHLEKEEIMMITMGRITVIGKPVGEASVANTIDNS